MKEYVILVDETFDGFSPGQPQPGGLAVPVTSTLAGAQCKEAQQVCSINRPENPGFV